MPQPRRSPRLDVHGNPLPELADAREEVLYEAGSNVERRRLLQALVERACREHLRHGQNVEVTIHFIVADGWIQEQIYETSRRRWGASGRTQPGWRHPGEGR
jgi:hypothetical protein